MKIFLDSINLDEIQKYQNIGIIDGVTTNPSLMSKSKINFSQMVEKLSQLVKGDISIEVVAENFEGMVIEGEKIISLSSSDNVVIKLPITWDGLKACKYFSEKNYKVNMTLCFSANQALLAAKCGATYVSPFIGRLNDVGADGAELIKDIKNIYQNYKFKTKILAASIRSIDHVFESALSGADFVTITESILELLVKHQLTDAGLKKFATDWKNSGMKI
ncbi:MAG TPA: transaldolase family protein [Candidatus Megaira endosymbiont of Nemacystus decipiens]|nr:transaldolase family protein [Candidatus Megaera endosymbiont of Nemacystus decipiens]